jgi:hypothetical protein
LPSFSASLAVVVTRLHRCGTRPHQNVLGQFQRGPAGPCPSGRHAAAKSAMPGGRLGQPGGHGEDQRRQAVLPFGEGGRQGEWSSTTPLATMRTAIVRPFNVRMCDRLP